MGVAACGACAAACGWIRPVGRLARGDVRRGGAAAGAPQVEADQRDGAPRLRGAGVAGVVGRRRRPVQQRAEVAARLRQQPTAGIKTLRCLLASS